MERAPSIYRDTLFAGKTALVTGGGTGIGLAIAAELRMLGADVLIGSRSPEKLAAGAEKLLQIDAPGRVLHHPCNIRDEASIEAAVDFAVAELGRIDMLVNNGGGQFMSPAEAIRTRGFEAVVATNLTGTWNMTRAAADAWMLEHGGRVVHITMLTARGFPGMAHSVAARAGVEAMTRTLAVEWAARGIRMNCIQPGLIASSGIHNYPNGVAMMTEMQRAVPLKRLGTTAEIAWLVAFLASPAGDYVTGQVWTVDGGKELWGDAWPVPDPDTMPPVVVPVEAWERDGA